MNNFTATSSNAVFKASKHQANTVKSNANSHLVEIWVLSLFWNALIFPFIFLGYEKLGYENLLKMASESLLFYIFVIFVIVAIYSFYAAIRDTVAWFKFGKSVLILNALPAQLGTKIKGYIDIKTEHDQKNRVTISLDCIHHYWKAEGFDDDNLRKYKKMVVSMWRDDITVRTRASAIGSRLYFLFQPPNHLPETQKINRKDYYEWCIAVELPLKGVDFKREYVIPVIKAP